MVVIDWCILKALHWNTLVRHTKKHPHHLCTVVRVMMCFANLCVITANKVQIQYIHIENESLTC